MIDKSVVNLENALLGAILVDENLFNLKIKGRLVANDFLDKNNQVLFKAISEIHEKGFDQIEIPALMQTLELNKEIEKIGGENYIAKLMSQPALNTNVDNYIQEIASQSNLREIKVKFNQVKKELDQKNAGSAEEVLEKFENDFLGMARGTKIKDFINSKSGVNVAIKNIEKKAAGEIVSGVPVDLPSIDKMTGGFQNGDLVIIAARPSMGKTALALNMAVNAATKKNVAFFSLEMSSIQLFNRILSFTAFIDGNKIRESSKLSDNEWKKIYLAKEKISKLNLFVDETSGIKLSELIWKAKRLHKNIGLDFIVIDYLQLITTSSKSDNRQSEVTLISSSLKKLARELEVPVIALSQLSRKVESRESKIPMMSDLRESGSIEQDADLVAFVYRESYYKKVEERTEDKEITDFIISKHRNGAVGNVKLYFKPEHGLFIEKGKD